MSIQSCSSPRVLNSPWRADFPLISNSNLSFLDSASSAQKPEPVISAVQKLLREEYSNINRGVYKLSEELSVRYEKIRAQVASFIGARDKREVIFTSGTTGSVNLLAYSYGKRFLKQGDEIIVSILEHHANFLPWQRLASELGLKLRVVGLNEAGYFNLEEFSSCLNENTKLVAITQLANAYGLPTPIEEVVKLSRQYQAHILVDGAQGILHLPSKVAELGIDFYCFSAHKLYAPTGSGILWGRYELLQQLPPFLMGGDMVETVTLEQSTFQPPPHRFEAGTQNLLGVVGLGAALEYLENIGFEQAKEYEDKLLQYLSDSLAEIPEVRMLGPRGEHKGLICFTVDGVHPHDLAQILSSENVAVRAGHHCAKPLLNYFQLNSTVRASLAFYNSSSDIDRLTSGIKKAITFFKKYTVLTN